MIMAAPLALFVAASRPSVVMHAQTRPSVVMLASSDVLGLRAQTKALAQALEMKIDASSNLVSETLSTLCSETILPLSAATHSTSMPPAERRTAIEDLSIALDEVEETAVGPLLSGARTCSADVELFPTLVLLEQTLPQHFGWTEYTDEALFWRRPRLHAYFALMKYEAPAKQVERELTERIMALELPWDEMAFEVPTSQLRKFPKHTL